MKKTSQYEQQEGIYDDVFHNTPNKVICTCVHIGMTTQSTKQESQIS